MRTLGLFVGVDDQEDCRIERLAFAANDAETLSAIFSDTYESDVVATDALPADQRDIVCLLGRSATAKAILDALATLARRSSEGSYDLAVVHFSCHGTPDGRLLCADALSNHPEVGSVSMDELEALLQRVVVRHMVVSFDTCFSGLAAGARAASVPGELWVVDLEQRVRALSRGNRAVLTASRGDQPAHESGRLRHGLLSYGMVHALRDASIRRPDGRISISRWIHESVAQTLAQAATEAVSQSPKQDLNWTDDPAMSCPKEGPRTAALRARDERYMITADPDSLAEYGVSASVCAAVRDLIRGGQLMPLQLRAVNEGGVMAEHNVVVAAPTSAGKTLIGYLAAIASSVRRGRTAILLPTKALANEKWAEFSDFFGDRLGADGIRAVRSFGGVEDDDAAIRSNHYDVAFLTYEKFLLLALAWPKLLDAVSCVVLDEVHLLSDPSRGRTVELLLTHLRRRAQLGHRTQLVALSAAMGNMNGFPEWLGATLIQEKEQDRPVPIREGVVSPSGRVRYRDSDTGRQGTYQLFAPIRGRGPGEYTSDLLGRVALAAGEALLAHNPAERLLAFRFNRPDTRHLAQEFANRLALGRCESPITALQVAPSAREETLAGTELSERLEHGVAFHISDLEQSEREAIEDAFRKRELKVMVATSGLAMGINTPASSVLIVDTTKFDGEEQPLRVAEVKNMAGRAGRMLAGGKPGASFICAMDDRDADRLFEAYVIASAEPLESQLSRLGAEDLVLALLMLTGPTTKEALLDVARSTFEGFQEDSSTWRRDRRQDISEAIGHLQADALVVRREDDSIAATSAGNVLGRYGISVASARRVVRGARALLEANEPVDEIALIALAQLTDEMQAAAYITTHASEESKWTNVLTKQMPGRPRTLALLREATLDDGSPDVRTNTQRMKKTFAIVQWIFQVPLKQIEKQLFAFTRKPPQPAAAMIRGASSRTGDLLGSLTKVLSLQIPSLERELGERVLALIPSLEMGVGRDAIGLAKYRLGLSRPQLLALHGMGITTFDVLHRALREKDPRVIPHFGSAGASELVSLMERRAPTAEMTREDDEAAQYALFDSVAEVHGWN